MSEKSNGILKFLELSFIYDLFQNIVGGNKWRKKFIEIYVNQKIKTNQCILDVGCGTGSSLSWLTKNINYLGIDRNSGYISKARKRIGENIEFKCCDVNELNEAQKFDVILCIGILHHLSDKECESLLSVLSLKMKKNASLFILEPLYDKGQSRLARFVVSMDRGKNVKNYDGYSTLLKKNFTNIESSIDLNPIRIPYSGVTFICKLE